MNRGRSSTAKNSLFISDIVILCLMILVLFFLIRYPFWYDNIIFRVLSAVIFIIIFYWKIFLVLIFAISSLNLIYLFKRRKTETFNLANEIIFLTFGFAISMIVGFIFAAGIRTGKPDIDPTIFFPYFNTIFILYLIARIVFGLLVYINKTKISHNK